MLRQGRHCLTAVQVCVLDMDHAADVQQLRDQGFEACYIGLASESSQGMLQNIATALQHQPLPGYEHEDAAQQLLKVVTASCTTVPSLILLLQVVLQSMESLQSCVACLSICPFWDLPSHQGCPHQPCNLVWA